MFNKIKLFLVDEWKVLLISIMLVIAIPFIVVNLRKSLALPEDSAMSLYDAILNNGVGDNGSINTDDSEQTFITGTNPNNYVYYSGLVWRVVSVDPETKEVKMVTQDPITVISYNASNEYYFDSDGNGNTSYAYQWLNTEFLNNLREPEKYIVYDYDKWDATATSETTKPNKEHMVTATVGLLNTYEYTMSYSGTTYENGYLNIGNYWYLLNARSTGGGLRYVHYSGMLSELLLYQTAGLRPTVVLKSDVVEISGLGTEDSPYVLDGELTNNAAYGTKLNTRYNGEFVSYGNQIYRIVDTDDQGIKLILWDALRNENGYFIQKAFDSTSPYSAIYDPTASDNIGYYLNNDYYNTWYSSLTDEEQELLVKDATWYLGTYGSEVHYNLTKCNDEDCNELAQTVKATIGLPTVGEWFTARLGYTYNTSLYLDYWTLTMSSSSKINMISIWNTLEDAFGPNFYNGTIRPVIYLSNESYIKDGLGTEDDPFEIGISTCDGLAGLLLKNGVGENGSIDTSDEDQSFIIGLNPNNYVYYSGLLWQAVSIDPNTCSVKMRTYDNIVQLAYNPAGQTSFDSDGNGNTSYMHQWLNDEFLNNLRDPEKYIVMDASWDITPNTSTSPYNISKPDGTNIVSNTAVGLLNSYEYSMTYKGTSNITSYLTRNDFSWLINAVDSTSVALVYPSGPPTAGYSSSYTYDVYPVINLKEESSIMQGSGTSDDPYVLEGEFNVDYDSKTKLNTRYSGEYITFGGEKYRIVDINSQGIKVTAISTLENDRVFDTSGSTTYDVYSTSNVAFNLNNNHGSTWYFTWYHSLTDKEKEMLVQNATWYQGTYNENESYKLTKCSDVECTTEASSVKATIGLPTISEWFTSGIVNYNNAIATLTLRNDMNTAFVSTSDIINGNNYYYYSKIVFYIDNDAYITGGLGTENSPYELSIDTTVNCDGLAGMLLTNGLGSNGEIDKSDSEQTFITGSNPNNYVYYSGLLWQAVSIDTDTCSVKMRTYDNIAQLSYNPTGQVSFDSDGNGNKSYMYQWLNGEFLNNLREPENYIVMDSDWNITTNTVNNPYIVKKPDKTNIVSNTAVGLLNVYEFSMAYNGLSGFQSYLARNDFSWLLNSYDATQVAQVYPGGVSNGHATSNNVYDVYPVVNLKESVDIIQGDGTSDNPYVLDGELNTTPGTKLNTRYSGEYVTFGGEKYRIVEKNSQGIKITSVDTVENKGTKTFDSTGVTTYDVSSETSLAYYLNNDSEGTWYHTWYNSLTENEQKMLVQNATWYQGTYNTDENYLLAKCTDTSCLKSATSVSATVGLSTIGEWFTVGSFTRPPVLLLTLKDSKNTALVPQTTILTQNTGYFKTLFYLDNDTYITGGLGTESSPYTLKVPDTNGKITIVSKIKISDINFEHGNPTFTFKVDGFDATNVKHTYYRQLSVTSEYLENYLLNNPDSDYITMDVSIENIIEGTYTVSELTTNRYELKNISDVKNGTTNDNSVTFNISDTIEGNVTFINNKINQSNLSHSKLKSGIVTKLNGTGLCGEILIGGVGENGSIDVSDTEQIFITGTNPNNYVYYSGLLWRVVSIDPNTCEMKLITQDPITAISSSVSYYNPYSRAYFDSDSKGDKSYAYQWLNNEFLNGLRDSENYIVYDYDKWDATYTFETTKPNKEHMVTATVGLLNIYEYAMSYSSADSKTGYLNIGQVWYLLNSSSNDYKLYSVDEKGSLYDASSFPGFAMRPVVVLKSGIDSIEGTGTSDDPYILEGELNVNASDKTKLSTRYNGEFVTYGNQTYRIVDQNDQGTKIILWDYLRDDDDNIITKFFDSESPFSTLYDQTASDNIAYYLNSEYYNTWYNNLKTSEQSMLVKNATWYSGQYLLYTHYNLAKCTDEECSEYATSVTATIGLPTVGEWFTSRLGYTYDTSLYPTSWTLTKYTDSQVHAIFTYGTVDGASSSYAIRPVIYLSNDTYITGGSGLESSPYTLGID